MSKPQSWSDIADWYDELVESGSGPHETALASTMHLAGDVAGLRVLDIACGSGMATRALARAGARVTGIDSSARMLDLARAHELEQPLGIDYVEDDGRTLGSQPDGVADGVTCQLGLMDIPDLAPALGAVHRVLRPGGWFVFVIGHPCFLAPDAETLRTADGTPRQAGQRLLRGAVLAVRQPPGRAPRRQPPPHAQHLSERPGGDGIRRRGGRRTAPSAAARRTAA